MYYLYSSEFYDWIIKVKIESLQNEKKRVTKVYIIYNKLKRIKPNYVS